MTQPDFAEVQRILTQARALSDAAEAHGTLAGALCASSPYNLDDWLAEILADGRAAADDTASLRQVFEATFGALGDEAMSFQPLLPADDQPIQTRTGALGEWCHGFLYGLGTAHLQNMATLQSEVGEILKDFTEITHVDVDPDDGEESNEAAYAELLEFVRVGVQILFEQLEPLRNVPRPSKVALH
jgi:uncharacterized protein YgfB (UPF0149 family)